MRTRALALVVVASVVGLAGCHHRQDVGHKGPEDLGPRVTNPPEVQVPPQRAAEESDGDGQRGWPDQLQPVFFAFDKYDLSEDARDRLTENARILREHPDSRVMIEGHCDERGTNEYNLALGDRRARATRDFLVQSGLPSGRFTLVSLGEERPFDLGHDESAWSQNRRAHFKVPQ